MSRTPHRPSQKSSALDAAVRLLQDGGTLSLDSVARAAGLTKPGLMYHFATKEALLAALVEHVTDRCERELEALLPAGDDRSLADHPARERLLAYAEWAITVEHGSADLVALADPRLRERMTELWAERFRPWVEVPADLPPPERARLHAVRLLADGCWFADASGILPVPAADRAALLEVVRTLVEGGES